MELSLFRKVQLAAAIWASFIVINVQLRRHELSRIVGAMEVRGGIPQMNPRRLGHIAERVLKVGPWKARCLTLSLATLRLLKRQGTEAQLVIGIPDGADSHRTHSWLEIDGVDVGPPPGRGRNEELARYA